jgi:hypothetical protein
MVPVGTADANTDSQNILAIPVQLTTVNSIPTTAVPGRNAVDSTPLASKQNNANTMVPSGSVPSNLNAQNVLVSTAPLTSGQNNANTAIPGGSVSPGFNEQNVPVSSAQSNSDQNTPTTTVPDGFVSIVSNTKNVSASSTPLTPTKNTVNEAVAGVVNSANSSAQNVPASVVVGENIKGTQPQNPGKVFQANNQTANENNSVTNEVKPITSQAVTQIGDIIGSKTINLAEDNTAKNSDNNLSLQINDILNAAQAFNPANLVPVKSQNNVTDSNQPISSPSATNTQINDVSVVGQVSQQILSKAAEIQAVSKLNFQLYPESLGRVTVQIALVDQSVSARFIVSNPYVKDALQSHLVDLKAALSHSGLQIDQLQVHVQGGSSNLLAQYFQYQQEGFGYRLPASLTPPPQEEPKNPENSGILGTSSARMSLVDILV